MPAADNFNDDELVAPKWLNNDFLKEVIQSYEKNKDVKVTNFKLTPGTVKGDHFASVMFRAHVDYKLRHSRYSKSVIIKTMPEVQGLKKEMLENSHIFETEIKMYTEILPKLESVLRSIGDDTKIGPNCLYYSLQPRKCIVLEDLVPLGYTVQRDRDLKMDEIKEVMRKLAVFHAISYYLNKKEPQIFDTLQYGFMNDPSIAENSFLTDGIKIFIEVLNEVPTLRKYKPYFQVFQKEVFQKCGQSFNEFRENPQKFVHIMSTAENFNNDELVAPQWLNKDFLKKVIDNYEKTDDVKKLMNIGKIMTSREHRKTQLMNKEFLDELYQLLPKYLHSGYFEDLI
ncbi:uncharacterized protein LOC119675691 [Teleopsis dalmanni]|uniref:uncharacterized protein LOC119675691 n=1 Tax=Teleopsis dalmanni TaxID=139649 RepID=UPI0018CE83C6|nr:uncharacterized protein LOC119675691 [Teleopsis dalmanni]